MGPYNSGTQVCADGDKETIIQMDERTLGATQIGSLVRAAEKENLTDMKDRTHDSFRFYIGNEKDNLDLIDSMADSLLEIAAKYKSCEGLHRISALEDYVEFQRRTWIVKNEMNQYI